MDERIWKFDIASHVAFAWKGCMKTRTTTFAGMKVHSPRLIETLAKELSSDNNVTDSLRSMSNTYYICRSSSMGEYNTYMQLTPDGEHYEPTAFGIVCFINWMKDELKRLAGAQQTFEKNHKQLEENLMANFMYPNEPELSERDMALTAFLETATCDELALIHHKLGTASLLDPMAERKYILPMEGSISDKTFIKRWATVKEKLKQIEMDGLSSTYEPLPPEPEVQSLSEWKVVCLDKKQILIRRS